jgi:deoxyribodipyrimidine photo-lyase
MTSCEFSESVEKHSSIRPLLPRVAHLLPSVSTEDMLSVCAILDSALQRDSGFHQSWTPRVEDVTPAVMECECDSKDDPRAVMRFSGGEDAALSRLQQWMFDDDNLKSYFEVRNGLMGEGYSSKLSPWLANGCISSRYVYYESKRYEAERNIINKSTYWITFELLCRDFFRLMCSKYGDRVFHLGGANGDGRRRMWSRSADAIRRWKEGYTGIPMVDANMRELLLTGWMSNRGRQIVASYLVHNLNVDWRIGADHFESCLLDHDVASNYGNVTMAKEPQP